MFEKPIVFVIGAGASHEYNLPLGAALSSTIAEKIRFASNRGSTLPTSGDHELLNHIRHHVDGDMKREHAFTMAARPVVLHVRYSSNSGTKTDIDLGPLRANSRHARRSHLIFLARHIGIVGSNNLSQNASISSP